MLVLIANREDPDLVLHCLSMPFWQATSVQNFSTFTILLICSLVLSCLFDIWAFFFQSTFSLKSSRS